MSEFAAIVETVEMKAEHRGRRRMVPEPHEEISQALKKHRTGGATKRELEILNARYWMFYAAGLYNPDDAADATIRAWRGETE